MRQVLTAGATPVILGGDHSITRANIRACAAVHGPVGVVHFDTHTDTGKQVFGVTSSRETFMRSSWTTGTSMARATCRWGCAVTGPGRPSSRGKRSAAYEPVHARRARPGIVEITRRAMEIVGSGAVFLTVDVDVLEAALVPGTDKPEPGGMSPIDLLLSVRTLASELDLVGADVVR